MTKKRKIEIIELLKKAIQTQQYSGLCHAKRSLWYRDILTDYVEVEFLNDLIIKHKPRKMYNSVFFYKVYSTAPRIKWINARIKELR